MTALMWVMFHGLATALDRNLPTIYQVHVIGRAKLAEPRGGATTAQQASPYQLSFQANDPWPTTPKPTMQNAPNLSYSTAESRKNARLCSITSLLRRIRQWPTFGVMTNCAFGHA